MVPHEVCRAIICDNDCRILLARRAKGLGVGQWALVGGKPDRNDKSPEDTITREVREELGLDLIDLTLFKEETDRSHDPEGHPWHVRYFVGRGVGQLVLQEENDLAAYFSDSDLDTLDIAFGHEVVIREFTSSKRTVS